MILRLLPALFLVPGLAFAQVDRLEATEGATHMSAIVGDGGLSVGIAPTGELTQLLWPSPLGAPLLRYQTTASADARTLPRFGAAETDGLFVGLWLATDGGAEFSWLRDDAWTHGQSYAGATATTTSTREDLGLRVVQSVGASGDVLFHRTVVEREDSSPVTAAWVVVYADTHVSGEAGQDWGSWWDAGGNRVISASLAEAPSSALVELAGLDWTAQGWEETGAPQVEAETAGLQGTFVTLGGAGETAVHIGAFDDCGSEVGNLSAFDTVQTDLDAASTSRGFASLCDTDVALSLPVEFKDDGPVDRGAVDYFVSAAAELVTSVGALEGARAKGYETLLADANLAADAHLAGLTLPAEAGGLFASLTEDFGAQWARSVVTVTDEETGSFAASLASQPRFHVDRPWESAWTELALELAGDYDAVSAHQRWLVEQQLTAPVVDDGVVTAFPGAWITDRSDLDIAQVGLTAWSFWRHGQFGANDPTTRGALASTWTALSTAADLLAGCVADDHPALTVEPQAGFPVWWPLYESIANGEAYDVSAGVGAGASGDWEALRPCASFEGGSESSQATLMSTNLARLGLVSAIAAAHALCIDEPRVAAWQARADELAALILAADYDGTTWTGDAALLAWPSPPTVASGWWFAFAASPDPAEQAAEVDAYITQAMNDWVDQEHARVTDAITLQTDGRGDEAIALMSGARWRSAQGGRLVQSEARALLRRLVTDLTTPGTHHLGAVFVGVDDQDGTAKSADQRVGQPHVPTASAAVSAMYAFIAPDRLALAEDFALEPLCVDGEEPDELRQAPGCTDECQNSIAASPQDASLLALLLGVLTLGVRRRR
ncbi:MAG: hypothetical protein KDA24_18950 [Deltaproteobacteria bacterium]|nr:hypothetical protein [Deltaproteobacteria bacterium]